MSIPAAGILLYKTLYTTNKKIQILDYGTISEIFNEWL